MTLNHSYLGANSPVGFYSLYQQAMEEAGECLIIKGTPGCGKSTFMGKIADALEQLNVPVERFRCSSDPLSLDGISIPALSTSYFDGTAPHILEPDCPGAAGSYIDLGQFADTSALNCRADELKELFFLCSSCYPEAYARLNTARDLLNDRLALVCRNVDFGKIAKRTRGIISREIGRPSDKKGKLKKRFVSSVSFLGYRSEADAAVRDYERVYKLETRYELTRFVTPMLLNATLEAGYDTIACYDPMNPSGPPEHILIPALKLAFVTSSEFVYSGDHVRNFRLDSYINSTTADRARIKFNKKTASCLIDEAVMTLGKAKQLHDEIELIYRDHIDFDGVSRLAQRHIKALAARL